MGTERKETGKSRKKEREDSILVRATEPDGTGSVRRTKRVAKRGATDGRATNDPGATANHAPCADLWTTRVGRCYHRIVAVPVRRPLPHVPRHVEHPERTRTVGEAADRSSRLPAVAGIVHLRPIQVQLAPGHRDALAATGVQPGRTRQLVAPRVRTSVRAPRRILPLGLGRQPLAGPRAVRRGLVPVHAVDRMVRSVLTVAELAVALGVLRRIPAPLHRA